MQRFPQGMGVFMGDHTKFAKFFIVLIFASFVFVSLPVLATVYLKGAVTLDGVAYTGTTYVSLYCKGDSWWGASAWDYVDSKGRYSFDSTDDTWNPCSLTNASTDWNSCEVYAYQWADKDIANSDRYAVDLDCSTTITQDLSLIEKEEIIAVTLKSGTTTLDKGMSVYCYQNVSPWGNGYETEADDDDVYRVKVTPGTYDCYAYCDWSYWYYRGEECPYAGNPRKTVTIAESDGPKSVTLDFTEKNRTIHMAVKAGSTRITSDVEVYCSGQSYPWTYSRASKVGSGNTYDLKVTEGSYYCSSWPTTWPSRYSGYPHVNVSVGSSVTEVDAELTYTVKDKKIRVSIYAGANLLTSNMNVYCYQQGGNGDYAYASISSTGVTELDMGTGTYRCSAYCNYWGTCKGAGYPEALVTLEESDTDPVDVTLTFLESNATLRGTVTGGGDTIWVSANGYDIASEDGGAATLTKIIKAATVTGGKANTTQVWASTKVSNGGTFELLLPAGSYMVSLWPSDTRYGSLKQEVTLTADATTIHSFTLSKKDAEITGTVTDANGNGVKAYIYGHSYAGDGFWDETDSDGNYSVYAIGGNTYNVTASPNTWYETKHDYCSYTREGMQAVTANDGEAQRVDFTIPTCDCTVTVNAINEDGDIASEIYASIDARPTSYDSGEWYYGIWGWLSGGSGQIRVEEDRTYKISMWLHHNDYSYDGDEEVTCSDGASSVDLTLFKLIEDAVSGGFVDADGNTISYDDISSYLYVYASKKDGRSHRNCDLTGEGYKCDLSEGTWIVGYSVWGGPYASSNNTANEVEVSSKGGQTHNLTFLRTGSIVAKVLDLDESAMSNVWVECNPFSAAQEGANDYQYYYGSSWCRTDGSGQCTMNVGAPPESESDEDKDKDKKEATKAAKDDASDDGIAYYCNAHRAFSYHVMSDEQEVMVTEGNSSEVTLRFEEPNGTIAVTVVEGDMAASALSKGKSLTTRDSEVPLVKQVLNASEASSPIASAKVYCFSPSGGNTEATTDASGNATNVCTTEDGWFCVAHNIVSNAYYLSEATEVSCSEEGTPLTLTLDHVTNVPESVSQTVTDAAEQSIMIELSDGASFFFPKGALGEADEMATVSVAAVITPFTNNKIPVSYYGYRVSAQDANGMAITQLNAEATFTLPLNLAQLDNLGLSEADIACAFVAEEEDAYTNTPCTIAGKVSFTVDHLTDFVIVGNGYLGGIQGEDGGAVGKEDATGGDDGGSTGGNRGRGGGGCALVEQQTYQAHLLGLLFVLGLLLPIPLVRIRNRK